MNPPEFCCIVVNPSFNPLPRGRLNWETPGCFCRTIIVGCWRGFVPMAGTTSFFTVALTRHKVAVYYLYCPLMSSHQDMGTASLLSWACSWHKPPWWPPWVVFQRRREQNISAVLTSPASSLPNQSLVYRSPDPQPQTPRGLFANRSCLTASAFQR